MGSNSSKGKKHQDTSQYGEIYLQTDKTAYCAGDTVTGTIYLNLISDYPGNQLFLKLKGKEVVHFAQTDQNNDIHQQKYSGKNEITKLVILVHTWETLSPGQFAIPFSFYLSHHLPSSFYQHGCWYLAFTEYKLEAFLKPLRDTDPKMKYKQPVVVRQQSPPNSNEDLASSVTKKLETCCCCKQGSATLKVNFEKNFYYPGETARVNVELDNSKSKLTNQKIYFTLKQNLVFKAQGKVFGAEIIKTRQKLPGISKRIKTNSGTMNLVLPRSPKEGDFEKVDTKNPKLYTLLHLPENFDVITSTTKGELIDSTYFLEVSCVMSGCCTLYPKVKLPVTILSPDVQLPVINTPGNWKPITLESVNLVFPIHDNEASKPLLSGQDGNMIEGKVVGKQGFEMIETNQMHPNQQGANNQNYFKNFS